MSEGPFIALTRDISPAIARCELTHIGRTPIDIELARAQHDEYESRLRDAGCRVQRLAAGPEMPDSVFIEDTAIVFDEVAFVTRPGASSRRIETPAVAEALRRHREVRFIDPPGTMDGGDVLVLGRRAFVGRSSRTNDEAIAQMRSALDAYGYRVIPVEVRGCLHLKSAVTAIGDDLVLICRARVATDAFAAIESVETHEEETGGANALRVGDRVIYSTAFPRTLERLERRGLRVWTVGTSEVAKAEGAITCCSLIFRRVE